MRVAMRLADKGGIDAVTMRKLGQTLGVQAMSLYNHVDGRDDILDGIADLVVREIELPSRRRGWRAALRHTAISAHDILARHPWACALVMSPARDLPARIDYMERILGCLRGAGFSAATTYHAYHAIDSHILGFTMWEAGHSAGAPDLADQAATFIAGLAPGAYPHLVEHAKQHFARTTPDGGREFAFGLDLILDGLARLRDGTAR